LTTASVAAFVAASALAVAPALAAAAEGAAPAAVDARTHGVASGGAQWLGPPPPALPRRVVSLAPSLTDLVVAMGLTDRLVGVTRYDDSPAVRSLPRVGGFLDPSPEAVLGLRPDLVLWMTDGGALPVVRRIASLGVPVRALPIVSIADLLAASREIGASLGSADAGDRLARELDARIGAVKARAARARPVRVLFVVGRDPLVVAGPGSYPDEVLRVAGGENVVKSDRPWPVYPLERAVADDPDVVIDGAVLEPAEGIARLASIRAVREGRVRRMSNDGALRPGPRLAAALDEIFAALHREAPQR
jgi:iron complex transport system substrate-binding protein